MNIQEFIQCIELQLGRAGVNPEDRFIEDLAAESIDMMHIVVAVEERTGINIPEENVPDLRTVGEMFKYIESNIS
jgi:acyl carrier protein